MPYVSILEASVFCDVSQYLQARNSSSITQFILNSTLFKPHLRYQVLNKSYALYIMLNLHNRVCQ
jgi:hypothetical protein